MAILFQNYGAERCCLCGDKAKLTGEHKIKASILRSQFGSEELYIGSTDSATKGRFVQGVGSKRLKFHARLCEPCNTARTQASDREFEVFNQSVQVALQSGVDPSSVFSMPRYVVGSDAYLNVFRYFAKILCCHIADISAPRPIRLSRFSIGQTSSNYIWLSIQRDAMFDAMLEEVGEQSYVAHGGLVVMGSRASGAPKEFHSSLTIGPALYSFHMCLASIETFELRVLYPRFYRWCKGKVNDAKVSESQLPT